MIKGISNSFVSVERPRQKDDSKYAVNDSEKVNVVEEGEDIVITVKIPKPEALIFSRRMKMSYQPVEPTKSFLNKVVDSVEELPKETEE